MFVNAVADAASILAAPRTAGGLNLWPAAFAEPGLQFAVALLLWMFPGPLARIAGSRDGFEQFDSDIAPDALQYVALTVLGVFALRLPGATIRGNELSFERSKYLSAAREFREAR